MSANGEGTSVDPVLVYKTLKIQQSIFFAIVAGLLGAIAGGACWAFLSTALGFRFGVFSIAIGILVGVLINGLGAGFPKYFGIIAAFFSILGYFLGNAFYKIHLIAIQESLSFFEVIPFLNGDSLKSMLRECTHVIDFLYIGAATVPAYHLSTRSLTEDIIKNATQGKTTPDHYAAYRLPALVVVVLVLAGGFFYISSLTTINKTYYYESGATKSEGQLTHGKENGPWTFWYNHGGIEYTGQYDNGKMVGEWKFFRKDGSLERIDHYANGILEGETIEYHTNGSMRTRSTYKKGYRNGTWEMFDENEKLLQKGTMINGRAEGQWETFYQNGQVSSRGMFTHSLPSGPWTYWTDTGVKSQESIYDKDGILKLINTWDSQGNPVIVNGRGTLLVVDEENKILESGSIENGVRVGRWEKRYANGTKIEVGIYKDGKYLIISAWTPEGEQVVMGGEGFYKTFYPKSRTLKDSCMVADGLREEKSVTYYEHSGKVRQTTYFAGGIEHDTQTNYFENGTISSKGEVHRGKWKGEWVWYTPNQLRQTKVSYVNGLKEGRQEYYSPIDEKLIRWENYHEGRITAEQIVE